MSMVVKNNIEALRINNLLDQNNNMLQKDLIKVATGMKINTAADDSAPWSISERMRVRIRALEQSNQNIQNDAALMKTAEGAVSNTIEILKTLKERAINAANDSNTDEDRATIQKEIDQFIDQIDDNALVQFNGKYLVDGSKNNAFYSSRTILLNQSLATNTDAYASALTTLKNRVGDSLEIQATDYFQVSAIIDGKLNFYSDRVEDNTLSGVLSKLMGGEGGEEATSDDGDLSSDINALTIDSTGKVGTINDKFNVPLYTPGKEAGIAVIAGNGGVTRQIAGFTISILDSTGNVKKAANAALDQFKLLQRAENQTGDRSLNFHVGPSANVAIKVGLNDMRSESLGLKGTEGNRVQVTTKEAANSSINVINNSLTMALDQQTNIGSILSRLDYTSANVITARDNDQDSESTIRDADMAKEMTNYVKSNVLLQTAQAMLAQANQNSSAVLGLMIQPQ